MEIRQTKKGEIIGSFCSSSQRICSSAQNNPVLAVSLPENQGVCWLASKKI
jgi:hypothetical protein